MRRLAPARVARPARRGVRLADLFSSGHATSSAHPATTVALPAAPASDVPRWIKVEHLPTKAIPGAELFAAAGCTACHTYAGVGQQQPRRAAADRDRQAASRHPLRDRAPQVPVVRQPGLADAAVRVARQDAAAPARGLPRGLQGHALAAATIPGSARLPRDHGRFRRAVRGAAARGARRGGLRDRRLRLARRDRGARRPSSTATPTLSRDETLARLLEHANGAARVYDPERLERSLRVRLREGRRVRDLPVLDGDARDDRLRRDAEPHPPRRVGRAEGGAPARAHAARDAALGDPSPQHAHAARGRRDDPLPRARLLPRRRDRRATSSTSSSRARSTSSGSSTRSTPRWGQS